MWLLYSIETRRFYSELRLLVYFNIDMTNRYGDALSNKVFGDPSNLIHRAHEMAGSQAPGIVTNAQREMTAQLEYEISRLKELQKVNRTVRTEEIDMLTEQLRALSEHLTNARLRLDAIRLIRRKMGG